MPRLPPSLHRRAYSIDPLLPRLLPACRDLRSARNELRWLREHAIRTTNPPEGNESPPPPSPSKWQRQYQKLVAERATGKPLQYVLGSQPFGDLEILCEKGVLIPRPETESITTHLAELLSRSSHTPGKKAESPLHILDLCTGTGCISLLLHALLSHHYPKLEILGVDSAPVAIAHARRNIEYNVNRGQLAPDIGKEVHFMRGDIFESRTGETSSWAAKQWDVITSNPPYISPHGFLRTTSRSVRKWEPKAALVPSGFLAATEAAKTASEDAKVGDAFYPRLLEIAAQVQAKVVLFEVADLAQAARVVQMVERRGWDCYEIWRDWPAQGPREGGEVLSVGKRDVRVLGEGNGRAVLAWTDEGGKMLGKA